jgi:hypothetical protein
MGNICPGSPYLVLLRNSTQRRTTSGTLSSRAALPPEDENVERWRVEGGGETGAAMGAENVAVALKVEKPGPCTRASRVTRAHARHTSRIGARPHLQESGLSTHGLGESFVVPVQRLDHLLSALIAAGAATDQRRPPRGVNDKLALGLFAHEAAQAARVHKIRRAHRDRGQACARHPQHTVTPAQQAGRRWAEDRLRVGRPGENPSPQHGQRRHWAWYFPLGPRITGSWPSWPKHFWQKPPKRSSKCSAHRSIPSIIKYSPGHTRERQALCQPRLHCHLLPFLHGHGLPRTFSLQTLQTKQCECQNFSSTLGKEGMGGAGPSGCRISSHLRSSALGGSTLITGAPRRRTSL